MLISDASSTPAKCEEREFLLSAEAMWREAAVVIEQSQQLRIELAQAALMAQRERYRHEEHCALCQQIEAGRQAAFTEHQAAAVLALIESPCTYGREAL